MKNEWYEIAVSYTDDGGTESIESKDTLEEAIAYAKNCDALEREYVDSLFIDKWYSEDGENAIRYDEPAVIINKETK